MKKVLIVIDMQNDFIDGSMGTKEAKIIVKSVKTKIEEYRKNKQVIIFTRDTHYEDYLNTQEGRNLPVSHCIKNTHGWELSSGLDATDCKIIDKPSFGSTELMEYLIKFYSDSEFEVIGLVTDICILTNVLMLKGSLPESKITVDASCCAGVTPTSHNNAIQAMKVCQINITNEEEMLI